jgi:hypothetical protein
MTLVRTGVVFTDAQGENVMHVLTTVSGAGTIISDILGISNADQLFNWEAAETSVSPSPTVATYPTVRVTAQLLFTDATGSIAKLWIPAVKDTIFLPDNVTVDPTAISTLIADCIGNLVAGSGSPVTGFLGGQLFQTKITGIASLQVLNP